jgi:hypothetical protein
MQRITKVHYLNFHPDVETKCSKYSCNDLWYSLMIRIVQITDVMIVHDFMFEVDMIVMGNTCAIST